MSATKQRRVTLKKELSRLSAQAAQGLKELRMAAEARSPGRSLVMAEPLALDVALSGPLKQHALEALVAAYGAAHGFGESTMCECFACRQRWTQNQTPASFLKVTLTRPDAMLLALLCWRCCTRPDAELQRAVTDGMKRDFLGDDGQVSTLAPAGRA